VKKPLKKNSNLFRRKVKAAKQKAGAAFICIGIQQLLFFAGNYTFVKAEKSTSLSNFVNYKIETGL